MFETEVLGCYQAHMLAHVARVGVDDKAKINVLLLRNWKTRRYLLVGMCDVDGCEICNEACEVYYRRCWSPVKVDQIGLGKSPTPPTTEGLPI